MITILPCNSSKQLSLFEKVPERIHRENPCFVPPFPGSIVKILSRQAPFRQLHGEIYPFVALSKGEVIGRIAAIINRSHNNYYQDKTGFFGFFDSIDDDEVSFALFETARRVLRSKGLTTIRGPYNPSINDEVGLLVQGFDSPPFVMMPFNPPYYVDFYQDLGLKPLRDLHAFHIDAALNAPERILKIVDRVKRNTGLLLRPLDKNQLDRDLQIIQSLYNETLSRNFGFVPLTLAELQYAAKDLVAIVDPELIMFAEKNGVPAGFSMVIPNINEFLWKTKDNNRLMRIAKFAWYLKTSRPREARLAVLGIKPEFRNSGIAALFYAETLLRGKRKYKGGELSWVEDGNEEIMKGIAAMGAKKYKTYRLYEGSLEGTT